VFIGLVSYPLYLWHWPLLALARIVDSDHVSVIARGAVLLLAFALAVLTYYGIELPLRSLTLRRIALPLVAGVTAIGALSYAVMLLGIGPLVEHYGYDRILRVIAEQRAAPFPGPRLKRIDTPAGDFWMEAASAPRAVFVGDSDVEQYYPRVDEVLTRDPLHARSVLFATGGGCPPLPGVHEAFHAYCADLVTQALRFARAPEVDTVVFCAAWVRYFVRTTAETRSVYRFSAADFRGDLTPGGEGATRALAAFEQMVRGLRELHKRVFIILQIPFGDDVEPRNMVQRELLGMGFRMHVAELSRAQMDSAVAWIDARLRALAQRAGAAVIDPLEFLCDHARCATLDADGDPMYRDEMHLRPAYVREHVSYLDEVLALPATGASIARTAARAEPEHGAQGAEPSVIPARAAVARSD
jgi:hypothetical protein